MENAGWVTRVKGEVDTRQRIVSLTETGKALEEQAKDIPNQLAQKVTKYVSVEELRHIIPSLDKLIEGLKHTGKK
jgi:DNA-binding MarR family transcriptional regulator